MENNIFTYTRVTYLPKKNPEDKEEVAEKVMWKDKFNINKLIRSMQFEKEVIVLLDDGHEQSEEVPVRNKKGGIDYTRQRIWAQSEIHLTDPDDIERWQSL